MIVCMPQRYSACFKLVSRFKNDDREREGNVKLRESQQIYSICGWKKLSSVKDGGGFNIYVSTEISITDNLFFFD